MNVPKKLAIYYNWLSASHPDHTVESTVRELAKYDMVVIAGSLARPTHGNHEKAREIVNHDGVQHVDFYGYVNTSDNYQDLIDHIQLWKQMNDTGRGRVVGIFCDRFGFDYPIFNLEDMEHKDTSGRVFKVNRAHQNFLVREIHNAGFRAFVNAWNQEDIFGDEPSTGRKHNLNPDDWSLLESYQINTGEYVPEKVWRRKMDVVNKYRGQALFGCTTTTANNWDNRDGALEEEADMDKFNYAYVSSIVDNLDAFSYGIDMFGAKKPLTPFLERPTRIGEVPRRPTDGSVQLMAEDGVYRLGEDRVVRAAVDTNTHNVVLNL